MPLVLDASVLVKLVVEEAGSDAALEVLRRGEACYAPDWAMMEAANALAGKVRHEGLPLEVAKEVLAGLPRFLEPLIQAEGFLAEALELAAQLNLTMYDCLYLAVGRAINATVVTADRKFVAAAKRAGMNERVELLTWSG